MGQRFYAYHINILKPIISLKKVMKLVYPYSHNAMNMQGANKSSANYYYKFQLNPKILNF